MALMYRCGAHRFVAGSGSSLANVTLEISDVTHQHHVFFCKYNEHVYLIAVRGQGRSSYRTRPLALPHPTAARRHHCQREGLALPACCLLLAQDYVNAAASPSPPVASCCAPPRCAGPARPPCRSAAALAARERTPNPDLHVHNRR
jgi:hypothetical protein